MQNKFNGYNVDTKLACEVKLEGNYFDIPSIGCQCEDGLRETSRCVCETFMRWDTQDLAGYVVGDRENNKEDDGGTKPVNLLPLAFSENIICEILQSNSLWKVQGQHCYQ